MAVGAHSPSQPKGGWGPSGKKEKASELLPRTEKLALLIGTAVCGKPHVRWCERAGEIKPSPLYSILFMKDCTCFSNEISAYDDLPKVR